MRTMQHGGEGKTNYSSTSGLKTGEGRQHGGEMQEKVTTKTSSNEGINRNLSGEQYCGPGKYLS